MPDQIELTEQATISQAASMEIANHQAQQQDPEAWTDSRTASPAQSFVLTLTPSITSTLATTLVPEPLPQPFPAPQSTPTPPTRWSRLCSKIINVFDLTATHTVIKLTVLSVLMMGILFYPAWYAFRESTEALIISLGLGNPVCLTSTPFNGEDEHC